jgi:2-C-methyl-D-erythritol 4-phosphate cytidylyltransferase/2-C-methyl-D-erythritol 2,4-cyclodiphosphate synthase
MNVTAVIAAGGRGERLGDSRPKQLLLLGGRAILERSVAAFVAHPAIAEVVVALPADVAADPPSYLRGRSKPVVVVAGGARRQDSVARAFLAADVASDIVVVHDAARPFVSADLITRTIDAAAESGAAMAAVPARDTVKRVDRHALPQVVTHTLPRDEIYLAQTPQAFRRDVLRDALALGQTADASDEAALVERAGHPVRVVEGESSNIKVTTAADLAMAEAMVRGGGGADVRVGTGYDLHRLVEGRRLVLGGVAVPSDRGALGHSDADVACHAITDAILGATGLGDIGRMFPDSDPRWKDASSLDLLVRAAALAVEHGYDVGNVDVTIVLERPKIREHVDAMRAAVAKAIGIDPERVSVKGKTNEGVDAVGRGEAVAAHAIALVRPRSLKPEA